MEFPNYFGVELSGGSNSSRGFEYQDFSALIYLFDSLNRDIAVKSLGVEMTNDFAIHLADKTIIAQVKKQSIGISDVKKILQKIYKDKNDQSILVVSSLQEKLSQLLHKRDQYRYAMSSDLDEKYKQIITKDYKSEIAKNKLDDYYTEFHNLRIKSIPEKDNDLILFALVWKWSEKQGVSLSTKTFIDHLLREIQRLRSNRSCLTMEALQEIAKEHETETLVSKIVKEVYDTQFAKPSEILTVLGETKEEILKPIEERLCLAEQYFSKGNYREALDVYSAIAKIYKKVQIYLQCAMLHEMVNEYERAIEYCDLVLDKHSEHYEANLIKGTSFGALDRYTDALHHLAIALSTKRTPEVHYNLGYTYWISKNNQKAIEHYKDCLELNDQFASAHLNLSICYFESMNYKDSLVHVNCALQIEPEMYQAYARKGELYRFLGLYDDAIEYFLECLSRDRYNFQALQGISICFAEKGNMAEAHIYFSILLNKYHTTFFKGKSSVGTRVMMVDMGWKRTLCWTLEIQDDQQIYVYVCDTCLPVTLKETKDFIFIGCNEISDDTGSILYPNVGKVYEVKEEFQSVIAQITDACELFQWFDKPLYMDSKDSIKVVLRERETYIVIEMNFGEKFQIIGMTDGKAGGFEAFRDYYEQFSQYRIHLECAESQEVFVIDGLKQVEIEYL